MSDLVYPTLDLFLYDFRDGVGDTEAKLEQNQQNFQGKLPSSFHKNLFDLESASEIDYLELLQPSISPFYGERDSLALQGYYYPVRLGDTYGLLLDCSINNQADAQPVTHTTILKAEIEARLNNTVSTIGQTWMMSGWLPKPCIKSSELIAEEMYTNLFPNASWSENLQGKACFLNATVFELWDYHLRAESSAVLNSIHDIQENQHVIIVIYPDQNTATKIAPQFYSDWMRLFYYRNKVLWAYGQSQWLSYRTKKHLTALEERIKTLQPRNGKKINFGRVERILMGIQDTLTDYNNSLICLNLQSHTLDVNINNYQQRLTRIEQKSGNDLNLLRVFECLVLNKYQRQISKNHESLTLGFQLLDSSLNTLRSRIEVNQAKRDRLFQNTVAILGISFAVASISGKPDEVCLAISNPIISLIKNSPICELQLLYSLFVAATAGLITWLFILLLTKIE